MEDPNVQPVVNTPSGDREVIGRPLNATRGAAAPPSVIDQPGQVVQERPVAVLDRTATERQRDQQVVRSGNGRLTLLHPTRAYAVSHNPFGIAAILPLLVLSFVGLELAMLLNADPYVATGGFMVVTLGLLLISAVTLRGSLTLTHDGINVEYGKHQITADWAHVAGIVNKRDAGLCLELVNPEMNTTKKLRAPGGLSANQSHAFIPLRLFGDRQYSIIYDLRERLPEDRWINALENAGQRSGRQILFVYGLTTLIAIGAMFATMYAVTH